MPLLIAARSPKNKVERPAILQFSSKALLQQIITSPRKFIGARAGAQAECAPRVIGFRSVQSPSPGAPVFPRALLLGKIRKLRFGNSHVAVCVCACPTVCCLNEMRK